MTPLFSYYHRALIRIIRSAEWKSISKKEKQKLGLVTDDDGEFWMSWEDFTLQFTDLSIVHLINTSLFSFSKTWRESSLQGRWQRPELAGGCLNHPNTFLANPQIRFDLPGKEEEEVVVQLSQKEDTELTRVERDKLVIGFHLIKVESNREYRLHQRQPGNDCGTSDFIRSRHVFLRCSLPPGRYLIVPSTFEPGQEGKFLLRIFSSRINKVDPLVLEQPPSPCLLFCGLGSLHCLVTRLTIIGAASLEKQDLVGSADPYVKVRCEGQNWSSRAVKNSLHPDWDFSVVCFRKKPGKAIKIEVWNSNLVRDQLMGVCSVEGRDEGREERQVELCKKGKGEEGQQKVPGTISLVIETSKDLASF